MMMPDDIKEQIKEKYKDRRICIAWPSPEKIDYRFFDDMIKFVTQNALCLHLSLANRVSSRIAPNRNLLVQDARKQGATDIMWIDGDTRFPLHGLLRLLSHNKDIVCATTARRLGNDMTAVGTPMDRNFGQPGQVLFPMKFVGFPFMLTKMAVFDKLDEYFSAMPNGDKYKKNNAPYFAEPPRWMFPEIDSHDAEPVGEDEFFCHHVRKAGFDIWCDEELSMIIGHIGSTIYYIAPDNRPKAKKIDEEL